MGIIGFCLLPFWGQARHMAYRGDYLGLVGELTLIKESSESTALAILNNPQAGASLKSRTIEAYNDIREIDLQLIRQISADARSRNSLCDYHKLDKMLTCNTIEKVQRTFRNPKHYYSSAKLEAYVYNLIVLEKAHGELMRLYHEIPSDPNAWMAMAGKHHTNAPLHGHSKVDYVCATLEKLELCALTSLLQKPDKKREQTIILKTEPGTVLHMGRQTNDRSPGQRYYHRHAKGKTCNCK